MLTTSSAPWLPPLVKGLVAAVAFAVLIMPSPLWRWLRRDDRRRARPGDNGLD